jgi:hypothetical protein
MLTTIIAFGDYVGFAAFIHLLKKAMFVSGVEL